MRRDNNINWRWVGLGGLVFLLLAGVAGQSDYEDAAREEAVYCANVKQYKDTGGQEGWPDYREVYNTMCVKDYIKS